MLALLLANSGTALGQDAADVEYRRLLDRIQLELSLRFADSDDPGLYARRLRLREIFRTASPSHAAALYELLGKQTKDNVLSRAFHGRLATATRRELLALLREPNRELEAIYPEEHEGADSSDSLLAPPLPARDALLRAAEALARARSADRTEIDGTDLAMLVCVVETARREEFVDTVIFAEAITPRLSELERGDISLAELTKSFLAHWSTIRPSDNDEMVTRKALYLTDSIMQVIGYVTRHIEHSGIAASPSILELNSWLRQQASDPNSLYHCVITTE